ncbi:hypothetical protein SAY87_003878 [Trapa incisa]|uniref:Cysteine-rich receptor-like protein kinase 42 n=1 Tax=Trapa incisa TaxID=236973 RepID=A0AAN7JMZ2_9MYRT|nr:hypothetical protein SAY87_003878 [Trapa incisa]
MQVPVQSSSASSCFRQILFVSSIWFFISPSLCDPRIEEVELKCGNSSEIIQGNIIPNFGTIMRSIENQVTEQRWGSNFTSKPPPALYGLAQCHGDLNQSDCLLCFAQSRTRLPRCLPNAGRLYLDGCFLRHDTYNFFNESTDPRHDNFTCTVRASAIINTTATLFGERVSRVLENVTNTAVANKGYAVAGEDDTRAGNLGAYALAQCWSTLTERGCRDCLDDAVSKIKSCVPGTDGRAMNAGCFLRYSTHKFYNVPISGGSSNRRSIIVLATSLAAIASLVIIGVFIGHRELAKRRQARRNATRLPLFMRKSDLNFKYESLEHATNYFDETRKLGQGGAGSVYKGILPNGKVVAVKRLVFNTSQWVDDFFNEVNLISGIQHKNLVRLLGCSIEGPESLLVYEYVPNHSLDQILFAGDTIHVLNWHERLRIVLGTAEGLAYLHSGCGSKIIHRDIKTSNILLDENMSPKIADFGLVRCVAPDRSHLTTGIAGTFGYMAPEYLVRGQLTEKADVYSFGVLVLEVLTGRKNSVFSQGLGSVLQSVWRAYRTNSLQESMDPALRGNFPVKEAINVLQIGLLCTQASSELRPSMPEVVEMLNNNKHCNVPDPKQPPFLNASVLSSDDSSRSSSTGILNQLSEMSSTTYTMRSSVMASPPTNINRVVQVSDTG